MSEPCPLTPDDRRRRCLATFARRLLCYLDRDHTTRQSIVAIARSLGDKATADAESAIDAMDELLSGE